MPLNFIHDFSAIREILSKKTDVSRHRHIFVFAGDEIWQKNVLKGILHGYEESSLWVGDDSPESYPNISVKKAKSWLGREKQIVIFDANKDFSADSFAAISGIVVGGGLFILLMPADENWTKIYNTYFGQRIIKSIQSSKKINIIKQNDSQLNLAKAPCQELEKQSCEFPFLSSDQEDVVKTLEKETYTSSKVPVVLISDRGRGKSAALGIMAARLMKSGIKKIIITAPRLLATDIVFKHIKQLLPEAEINRGQITLKNSVIQFYSPDQLSVDNSHQESLAADLLLVDEAAAIPVPLLSSFLKNFPQCIFATTVHGYEGTGRGFSVRFNKVLDNHYPDWIKLKMKMPIRWAENDPLEQWMFRLLCLDAEITDKKSIGEIDNEITISVVEQKELSNDDILLDEIFSLLVTAHYRTQPSDLQRLLDNREISIYVVKNNQHVIAVALVNHEGNFPLELSTEVYRGERRPSGHLLAQALTYHCGVEHAASLNYSRVMRIAVHPEFQEQGIGSKLLDYIVNNEKKLGYDAIGTSFGLNYRLLNFWKASGFNVVRIGFKREQTSGEHAAIMMQALNQRGEEVYEMACERFYEQLPYWFNDVLQDLPVEIKESFLLKKKENDIQLSNADKKDIHSFINYSRNYELCISALNKLVLREQKTVNKKIFPDDLKRVLIAKIIEKKDWKKIAVEMNLNGKAGSRALFKKAIVQLLK